MESQPPINSYFANFVAEMKIVFDHPILGRDAASRLLNTCHGSCSLAKFSFEFWTIAVDSGWNDEALQGFFLKGLLRMS